MVIVGSHLDGFCFERKGDKMNVHIYSHPFPLHQTPKRDLARLSNLFIGGKNKQINKAMFVDPYSASSVLCCC